MNFNTVNDIKRYIENQLIDHLQEDCVILNSPDHVNIGDQLIFQGELDFLSEQNITPKYICSLYTFDWRTFSENTLIFLHGGGNFGDVWRDHQEFRLEIIKKYRNNRIVIFPQSVQYNNEKHIKEDAAIFSQHPDLTICARDNFSYDLLKKHFDNNILLVPDMAFCSRYENKKSEKTHNKLLLKRRDKELPTTIPFHEYKDFSVEDWPTFTPSVLNLTLKSVEKVNRMFSKNIYYKLKKGQEGDTTFGLGAYRDTEFLISKGVEFISNYDLVVTTRLHGHILSILLGVPSIMIDNNYGKNSRFYNSWLQNIPNNALVSNKEELDRALENYLMK